MNDHLDIVKYFTKECKCDVNSKDNIGETLLQIVSYYYDHVNIVNFLVE